MATEFDGFDCRYKDCDEYFEGPDRRERYARHLREDHPVTPSAAGNEGTVTTAPRDPSVPPPPDKDGMYPCGFGTCKHRAKNKAGWAGHRRSHMPRSAPAPKPTPGPTIIPTAPKPIVTMLPDAPLSAYRRRYLDVLFVAVERSETVDKDLLDRIENLLDVMTTEKDEGFGTG